MINLFTKCLLIIDSHNIPQNFLLYDKMSFGHLICSLLIFSFLKKSIKRTEAKIFT